MFRRRTCCKVSYSTPRAWEMVKVYNGRANVENQIKETKNTLRWDKTSCHRFEANQAGLKMGALAYNLLHMIREFYLKREDVGWSKVWVISRIIKAASRISYHGRRWWVQVASSFQLVRQYLEVLGASLECGLLDLQNRNWVLCSKQGG